MDKGPGFGPALVLEESFEQMYCMFEDTVPANTVLAEQHEGGSVI